MGNANSEAPKSLVLHKHLTQTPSVTALHLNATMQPSVTGDVTRSPGHLKKSGFHRNTSFLSLNHNKHEAFLKRASSRVQVLWETKWRTTP